MTNKQGRVTRKNRPEPDIPQEPPLIINCLCPHCNASFTQEKLAGSYLNRRCPVCNQVIEPGHFDQQVKQVKDKIRNYEIAKDTPQKREAKYAKLSHVTRFFLLRPLHKYFEKKRNKAADQIAELTSHQKVLQRRITSLALMRYYTSEWYVRTGQPLTRKVIAPFQLVPYYDKNDVWKLPRGKKALSGMTAEFAVFEALLKRVTDQSSEIFYHAQLVPNIYLPRHSKRGVQQGRFWDQIDLVLLTRYAAFVIEVKRRYKDIKVNAPYREILSKEPTVWDEGSEVDISDAEIVWDTKETAALTQNSYHALAVNDVIGLFPFERIYEQVVFVEPYSFVCNSSEFVDNVNVSAITTKPLFIRPIEKACRELEPIATQEQIDQLGEELVSTYGDINQKRAMIHIHRIQSRKGEQ